MRDGLPPMEIPVLARLEDAVLHDIVTAPAARGRGFATALCRRLLTDAAVAGAHDAAARRLHQRPGFAERCTYWHGRPAAADLPH
jgi:GNAT superfamily N-acetyltransferase